MKVRAHGATVTAAAIALLGAACGNALPPTSPPPPGPSLSAEAPDPETPFSRCSQFFVASGDPASDIVALGRECGARNKQHPLTAVREGRQTQSDAVDRFTFTAGGEGKCYRIFGVGEQGVSDLDIQLVGPRGEVISADSTKDPFPMVPPRELACLATKGIYTVEVSVLKGAGRYAVQVWSN